MSLSWAPIWGWATTSVLATALVLFVLLTYPARVRHLTMTQQRVLIGLRLLSTVVILVALFRPGLKYSSTNDGDGKVAFLYDSSRSMQTKDGAGELTRWGHLKSVVDEVAGVVESLGGLLPVAEYEFGEQMIVVGSGGLGDEPLGTQTPLGATLERLLENSQGEDLKAVFLLSDGAERSLPPLNVSPRSAALELAKRGIPLYTVPFGSTSSVDRGLDLLIDDLTVDPMVFEKKTIPIKANLRVTGSVGRDLQVRLLVEDRIGKRVGESGPMLPASRTRTDRTEITIPASNTSETIPVEFTYTPLQAGEIKIGVEVLPIEGEVLLSNNRRETLTTVRSGGLRVAYFDVLRNEVKFVRSLNSSTNIQIDYQLVAIKDGQVLTTMNPASFEAGAYDVYIIGDVPAVAFGAENLRSLAGRVRDGAGLLMLGGYHNYSAGGYATSELADWLPVELNAAQVVPLDRIDLSGHVVGEFTWQATAAGLASYVMQIDTPERNAQTWSNLPSLTGINKLRPKNDAVEILATTTAGDPVVLALDVGRSRSVALASDETYFWYLSGQSALHQRFWRQLVLWLAHKEFETDQSIWVRLPQRNYAPGAEVEVSYGVRGQGGVAVSDATFDVEVINPEGTKEALMVQRGGEVNQSRFTKTSNPGDYWITVDADQNGSSLGLTAVTRLIVDQRDLEMDRPAADPGLLAQLSEITAELTDGQLIPPEQFGEFLEQYVRRKPWKSELETSRRVNLWEGWPVLLVFVMVLSAEWILRKRMELT